MEGNALAKTKKLSPSFSPSSGFLPRPPSPFSVSSPSSHPDVVILRTVLVRESSVNNTGVDVHGHSGPGPNFHPGSFSEPSGGSPTCAPRGCGGQAAYPWGRW